MRVILSGLLSTFSLLSFAQTQVYYEDFGTATLCGDITTVAIAADYIPTAAWRVLPVTAATNTSTRHNRWRISARETGQTNGMCSNSCLATGGLSNSLHISIPTDPDATYNRDSIADIIVAAPPFNPSVTNGNLKIEFDYLLGGDTSDKGWFSIGVGAGNNINTYTVYQSFTELPKTTTTSCPFGEWKHYTIYLSAAVNTVNPLNIAFRWKNDANGSGSDPSFAIDNLAIYETPPLAQIGIGDTAICNGSTLNFQDASLGVVTSWNWDFDGGATNSTIQNPTATFNTTGIYQVILTASNNHGSTQDTINVTVINCDPPTPDIYTPVTFLCQGQCIDFFDASTAGTYGMGQWSWQFQGANPGSSNQQNPVNICYSTPGSYDVILTVTDTASGLDSTVTFSSYITVGECQVPTAAFKADTTKICHNDCVEFYNLSLGVPEKTKWEFGELANPKFIEGNTEDVDTVLACFTVPGLYTVTLTVWTGNDSSFLDDTVGLFQQIQVDTCPTPHPDFAASSRKLCPGTYVVFEDLSLYATEWEWEFPGGQPSLSVDQHPEILYDSAGFYPVILRVKNVNGDSTLIIEKYIEVDSCLDPRPQFEVESDSICRGTCVQFKNTSLRADSIFWIFWRHPDTTFVADTAFGDTIWVTSHDSIVIDTIVKGVDFMPLFYTATGLHDTIKVDTLFMEQEPIFCFNDSIVVGVQLFAFNQYGVAIENQQDLPVLNVGGTPPSLSPGPDKYVRVDNINSRFFLEDTVRFEPVGTGKYYTWFPLEGLSCYDCQKPIIHPDSTRKYYITNFDDYGCQAFDSVIVYVENSFYAGIPNIFSPNGDGNNDILWVRGNGIKDEGYLMRVWNRYGELVFESYSQNEGWNGTFKSAPAPMGAYTYQVKLVFLDGSARELYGSVMLVRH